MCVCVAIQSCTINDLFIYICDSVKEQTDGCQDGWGQSKQCMCRSRGGGGCNWWISLARIREGWMCHLTRAILSRIRPHHMRVFVFVYRDPLCCVHASPFRLSVCLSGTKLG